MSWAPTDLVSDADLTAYEAKVLTSFNVTDWAEKRRRALEDWLAPILRAQGFDLARLKTRFEPDSTLGYTASAYSDQTGAAKDSTADDVNLAGIFATPANDALYIGSAQTFRGLSIRLLENVSAVASALTVKYWADAWQPMTVTDGTAKTSGKTFSGGGSVSWAAPSDWIPRKVNAIGPYYWVRVSVSATPTGAKAAQIGAIRRSVLSAPATLRTLLLIMREAPTGGPGPWADKADWYESEADAALQRAIPLLGGEFDTDASDQVSETEAAQTESEVSNAPFRLLRA
jgi:hypothetical protein